MANHWSRERVLSEIKRRHQNGWRLNLGYVQDNCRTLYYQAVKYFTYWRTAVKASGINYDGIRLFKAKGAWTQKLIISEIQRLHTDNLPINSKAIFLHQGALWNAACSRFGSWKKAVIAAGIDYASISIRVHGYWNQQTVVAAILQRVKQGQSLCVTTARKGDKRLTCLICAAQAHWGTWRNAIKAAGLNDQEILRTSNRHWTFAKIVDGIRKRYRKGKSLGFRVWSVEDQPLYVAVMKHIGSRELGIIAAGIDPLFAGGKFQWNNARIVKMIRLIHANGESLAPAYVNRVHKPVFLAARDYFGSWKIALAAAGFDYRHWYVNNATNAWLKSLDLEKTGEIIQRTFDMIAEEKTAPKRRKYGKSRV